MKELVFIVIHYESKKHTKLMINILRRLRLLVIRRVRLVEGEAVRVVHQKAPVGMPRRFLIQQLGWLGQRVLAALIIKKIRGVSQLMRC